MPDFLFISGAAWLDFVNTVVVMRGRVVDLLEGPPRLDAWLDARATHFGEAPSTTGALSDAAFSTARELRAVIRQLAVQRASGEAVDNRTLLTRLNEVLTQMTLRLELIEIESTVRERLTIEGALGPLFPVVRSVVDYLTGDARVVRQCENPDCILFFLESPRSPRRRWCSMAGCGNRMKAARHYRRRAAERPAPRPLS